MNIYNRTSPVRAVFVTKCLTTFYRRPKDSSDTSLGRHESPQGRYLRKHSSSIGVVALPEMYFESGIWPFQRPRRRKYRYLRDFHTDSCRAFRSAVSADVLARRALLTVLKRHMNKLPFFKLQHAIYAICGSGSVEAGW